MKKIATIAKLPARVITKGEWGLEIEMEGQGLPVGVLDDTGTKASVFWRVDHDGSLRGGLEYVLKKPKSIPEINDALENLSDNFKKVKASPVDSVRAGVHVHLNVQDWTINRLFTFATCYFILEDILVKWCGENRSGNLFCLRSSDAENVLFQIADALTSRNLRGLNNEDIRYCSLNFCSLFKYGSVEFRAMRSTPDFNEIFKWILILNQLKENSAMFKNPADVVGSMSGAGGKAFLQTMLPDFWEELETPDCEDIILKAARRVQIIAFHVDWEEINKELVNKNPFDVDLERDF